MKPQAGVDGRPLGMPMSTPFVERTMSFAFFDANRVPLIRAEGLSA